MGLFDAFKKKDRKKQEDLDLPPPPPSFDGMSDGLPDFPELDDNPRQGAMPSGMKSQNDDFDFSKEQEIDDMKMPEFPETPDIEDSMDAITAPHDDSNIKDFDIDEDSDSDNSQYAAPKIPQLQTKAQYAKSPVQGQNMNMRAAPSKPIVASGTTYLKVDDFRLMLGTISSARSEIRRSEENLVKLENLKISKDKSFDKIKASLEDIQKKLIFMDKTIFKGE